MEKQISSLVVKNSLGECGQVFKNSNAQEKLKFIYGLLRKIEDNRENLCHIMNMEDPAVIERFRERRDCPYEVERECLELLQNTIQGQKVNGVPEIELGKAYAYLGIAYEIGAFGLVIDYKQAYDHYLHALRRNHAMGALRLAIMAEKGIHLRRSFSKAFSYYKCAAKMGLSEGMHAYGMMLYYSDNNRIHNYRLGFYYIRQSITTADAEYPHPYFDLARIYETGNDEIELEKDIQYAYKLYVRGASFGCPNCCYRLARAFEYGELARKQSWDEALWWYKRAAELGQIDAQMALSTFYITGVDRALDANYDEAYFWTLKAAVSGHSGAAYSLGGYIEKGIGIKKDKSHALWWYSISGIFGNKNARYKIEQLTSDVNRTSMRRKRWWFLPC